MGSMVDPFDRQFEESVIEDVRDTAHGYEIRQRGGWVITCPKVRGLPAPAGGETLRLYGRGIGSPVRGIVVSGRVYQYRTEAEETERHEAWCRAQEATREQEYATRVVATDARIAALPAVFRARIEKFQRDGGHAFRRDYEPYELFCCEQAVLIAAALKTAEAISSFHSATWEEQQRLVPGLSDDHSGNTFGTACALARVYLERPAFVTQLHGALTPLVGCDAYGCRHPVSEDTV